MVAWAFLRRLRPYDVLIALLQRVSFNSLLPARHRRPPPRGERVAYVLLRYPGLTDTFIRREVMGLRGAGIDLEVFARTAADRPVPVDPSAPAGPVTYFGPVNAARSRIAALNYLRKKPWTFIRLGLFITRHAYGSDKTGARDRRTLVEAAWLAQILARHGVTRIHAPWADQAALFSFVASRLLGVPFTVQARASEIHRSTNSPAVADRVRFADFVITNSHYNERYLSGLLRRQGTPPIHVIYNGLELSSFTPGDGGTRGGSPLRILSVGRLVEPKGFRYLLRACRMLKDWGCDFTCEIIGGPQDPDDTVTWLELRRLHTDLGLESIVDFCGAQPFSAVLAAYRRGDIFVLPCVRARDGSHDITPNALIEAMAMGLPVVSTTSGAIPEIVDHGINGLLVPTNDEQALAEALRGLLHDPVRRRALGQAARRKIEQRFDIAHNVQRRVTLFQG
ncbi:MAG: glycosyltransferase family 4 protein [Gemmatimonadota bacterium]|nr:glycosyltransferase family 4 protein [Gemmatimonadota bacterium]